MQDVRDATGKSAKLYFRFQSFPSNSRSYRARQLFERRPTLQLHAANASRRIWILFIERGKKERRNASERFAVSNGSRPSWHSALAEGEGLGASGQSGINDRLIRLNRDPARRWARGQTASVSRPRNCGGLAIERRIRRFLSRANAVDRDSRIER